VTPGYRPGAASWLSRPLEVGSETFPIVHRAPAETLSSTEEPERDPTAPLAWPRENWWCE